MTHHPDQAELKACPFCGFAGSDYVGLQHVELYGSNEHRIRCGQCRASTGPQLTDEAAIAAWDTRSTDNPPAGEVPYLVFSWEHNAFWRADECGYTRFIEKAGRYTKERAEGICQSADYRTYADQKRADPDMPPSEICFPAPEATAALRQSEWREAIRLRRSGDYAIVSVILSDGREVDLIREHAEANFCHIIEPSGIARAIEEAR